MKAVITLELTLDSVEAAQQTVIALFESERQKGTVSTYSFEIEGPAGVVTERCVLSGDNVVA